MKLKELIEQYGEYEVKNGFMELLEIRYAVYINDFFDEKRLEISNMFLKKKEAKFAVERLKVIAELKKYAKEFSDEEWMNLSIRKYYITFVCKDHVIKIGYVCYSKGHDIHFESEEKAREAIKAVGEDRIKKYYLGVKE